MGTERSYVIHGFEPERVFRYFEEISAIPRPSGHEGGVADYLETFAAARGLACERDRQNNVLIRLPATPGREERGNRARFSPGSVTVAIGRTSSVGRRNQSGR